MSTDGAIADSLQTPADLVGYAWPPPRALDENTLVATRQLARVIGTNVSNQSLVLKGIDLDIHRGEFVSIVGASGSGKSTLLYLLGGLDRIASPADGHGDVYINGQAVSRMGDGELTAVRNATIGFVFQFHFLLPEFTALENVTMPMVKLGRLGRREAHDYGADLLGQVGLGDKTHRRTTDLSGGEQQRVAIARALANDPDILLADEPTGNLDKTNSQNVAHIFEEIAARGDRTILMVTHDPHMAEWAYRIVTLDDGRIVGDVRHR